MSSRKQIVKASVEETVAVPKNALVAFAAAMAPFVAAILAKHATGDVFTSLQLPPHTTRRAFRERCTTIATATKNGHLWTVPRADWFASFRQKPMRSVVERTSAPANDELDVDACLAAAGFRPTMRRSA